MINKDVLLTRIVGVQNDTEKVISRAGDVNPLYLEKVIHGCISINNIVGHDDNNVNFLIKSRDSYLQSNYNSFVYNIVNFVNGYLENLKSDIESGFLVNVQKQAIGEVFGDFVSIAKKLLEVDNKDAAAVLACGALEDSLKRYAINNGLDCYDSELSQVVNGLKSKSLLKGPQAGVVSSYVSLRNKAFHAQFDKIEVPEVKSLIAFLEAFLLENFS